MLDVAGVTVQFGAHTALRTVDLTVRQGELVAIAGEPGAGKTTLVRCLGGDLAPTAGAIAVDGVALAPEPAAARRRGVSVVWQDLALCDNLDVAGNVLLGSESRRLMLSRIRFHVTASDVLDDLRIPIRDTTRPVGELPDGQRRLVAIAQALTGRPRLLVLDEPTARMGTAETAHLEALIARLRESGTTVLLVSGDIEQLFRIADRIVILRHGEVVADVDPRSSHPDDVAALQSGRRIDASARRQLTRLHGLSDRLISADPASSLSLILSALGAALGVQRLCLHVEVAGALECEAALGFTEEEVGSWSHLEIGDDGGPAGRAAASAELVVADAGRWPGIVADAGRRPGVEPGAGQPVVCWSMPVPGPAGVSAVITALRPVDGAPDRDQLDLLELYAGYAAGAVERDRLLHQVTARNRVLETTAGMLETLAGPVNVADGLQLAVSSLCRGLEADEAGLVIAGAGDEPVWRAYAGPHGAQPATTSTSLVNAAGQALSERRDGTARVLGCGSGDRALIVPFNGPAGPTALVARWASETVTDQEVALAENAAHTLRLALEREEAAIANEEAAALRRSRQLQRGFLSRLSHELRTPLTAIRGYASTLMAPDVTWDEESETRFVARIAAESARLGRLVDDLLDFSAIESGVMRMQPDWCDLRLVLRAAIACLPPAEAARVSVQCDARLSVWGDHDRLEQVFVNLLVNAFRHNPPETTVSIAARELAPAGGAAGAVEIVVADDGRGFPPALASSPFEPTRRERSSSSGAGLGLSIANGIVVAHGGRLTLEPAAVGTSFRIVLPVDGSHDHAETSEPAPAAAALAPGAAR